MSVRIVASGESRREEVASDEASCSIVGVISDEIGKILVNVSFRA